VTVHICLIPGLPGGSDKNIHKSFYLPVYGAFVTFFLRLLRRFIYKYSSKVFKEFSTFSTLDMRTKVSI